MPNRSTLMTGRMPSLHGVRSNGTALNLRANTFVDLMRTHGYRTALLGKSHLQNMTGMPAIREREAPPEDYLAPPESFMEAMRRVDEDGPVDVESPHGWHDDPTGICSTRSTVSSGSTSAPSTATRWAGITGSG